MPLLALWSTARSRSTAFFRSMAERPDLLALHEPMERIVYVGPLDVGSDRFATPESLIDWLLGTTETVFLKETLTPPVVAAAVANRRYLTEARHAFLIRRPEEVAASFLAVEGNVRIMETGVEALHDLYVTVRDAGGRPLVIDSDDLVTHPAATMRAYCDAVGIPFIAEALSWEPGLRPEWAHAPRWHADVSMSSGFGRHTSTDHAALAANPDVRAFADHHRPFYDKLFAERLRIEPPEV